MEKLKKDEQYILHKALPLVDLSKVRLIKIESMFTSYVTDVDETLILQRFIQFGYRRKYSIKIGYSHKNNIVVFTDLVKTRHINLDFEHRRAFFIPTL